MSEQPHILVQAAVNGETSWTTLSICAVYLHSPTQTEQDKSRDFEHVRREKAQRLDRRGPRSIKDIKNQLYRILLIVTWFDVFKFSCLFKLEDIRNFASSFVTKHGGQQLLFLSSRPSRPSRVWEGTGFFVYILYCKHFSETGGLESAVEESKPRTGFRISQTRMTEQFAKRDMSVEFEQLRRLDSNARIFDLKQNKQSSPRHLKSWRPKNCLLRQKWLNGSSLPRCQLSLFFFGSCTHCWQVQNSF